MTETEMKAFLAQFEQSRQAVAAWPKWMRDAAYTATASFPRQARAAQTVATC